jgi:hypothetical protein
VKLKKGVRITGIRPELVLGLTIAESVWLSHGEELVVTSVIDSSHSEHSRHYIGCAADLRTRYFAEGQSQQVGKQLQHALGDDFFVLVEKTHIHMSFKPKEITS